MSNTRPSDWAAADGQPDLFDRRASYGAERVRVPIDRDAGIAASRLTDGELIAILPEANLSNVETLCAEGRVAVPARRRAGARKPLAPLRRIRCQGAIRGTARRPEHAGPN